MFDPERLLGYLIRQGVGGAFGGKKKKWKKHRGGGGLLDVALSGGLPGPGALGSLGRSGGFGGGLGTGTKATVGLGLLGVAIAAYEHYTKQPTNGGNAPAAVDPDSVTLERPRPAALSATPTFGGLSSAPRQSAGFGAGRDPAPPTAAPPTHPRYDDVVSLVRAMVAAAAADGLIDSEERSRVLKHVADAGLDDETRRFLEGELDQPRSLAAIVASARPEIAPDIYAASAVAITRDSEAERVYLDNLAERLGLTAEARREIDQKLGLDEARP